AAVAKRCGRRCRTTRTAMPRSPGIPPPELQLSWPSLHLQVPSLGCGQDSRLIHGLDPCRTGAERTRRHHLQKIEILPLRVPEEGLKQRGAVVVKFPPREEVRPPRRFFLEFVQIVALDELRPGRDRVLDHEVLPVGA